MSEQKNNQPIDVYAIVTNQIIEQLTKGTVPWQKPWTEAGLPMNLVSKKHYKGINVFLLASLGYEQNLFLSFQQVQDNGGKVKKGEKGHIVVFWKKAEQNAEEGNETEKKKQYPLLRYYKVFNIAQCENLPENIIPVLEPDVISPLRQCEEVMDNIVNPPRIQHKEAFAYYDPQQDILNMPKLKKFKDSESYYAVLFHELVHSTGHPARLNRKELTAKTVFGSHDYSIEELVGEIGSCYLQSHTGIVKDNFENSAGYIDGWLTKLRSDKRFIFYASSRAQQAVEYILNIKQDSIEEAEVSTD